MYRTIENKENSIRLGIDIGGTNIKFAVIDEGKVLATSSIKTAKTCDGMMQDISREYERLSELHTITTVGVGVPGIMKDGLLTAVNLPFHETPLKKLIEEKIGLPVTIDNDANCAALGEVLFGDVQDCNNIVLVTLGTGVGGGIIMNRRICNGKAGMGEIGHIVIQAEDGLPCPCGLAGCWEQYASATALLRQATKAAESAPDSILYQMYVSAGNALNGEAVFSAMEQGCPVAKQVFDKYLSYLAVGIRSLVNIFAPDAIILAGGITRQGDKLLQPLRIKLPDSVRVEISTLQNDAGALGAAML